MYVFLRDAFGPAVAFLFGWTMFLVIGSGSLATLGAAFPRYVGVFVPLSPVAEKVVSLAMIAVVTALNVRGTRQSADVQGVATALKVAVIVVLATTLLLSSHDVRRTGVWWPLEFSFATLTGAVTGMIGVLWAYEGWQYVTFSAGETLDPQRTFARGIVIGTLLLIAIYVFANVGYFAALGVDGVANSRRVASDAASAVIGPWAARVLAAVILVSIFSASNGMMLTLPRVFFAMARDRLFIARLARVHPRFGTPAAAIVATALWSAVLVLSGSFEQLLTYVVFMSWIWFALAALAIFVYRRREPRVGAEADAARSAINRMDRQPRVGAEGDAARSAINRMDRQPDAPRRFRTPGYPLTPLVFVFAALVIVVNTVVAQPVQSLVGLTLAALGVPAYAWWRRRASAQIETTT
jgi:APA family basic amino acid/polyamine antiporter